VEICEDPENVKRNPPSVVVELFDHDKGLVRQLKNCNHFTLSYKRQKDNKNTKTLTKNKQLTKDKTKQTETQKEGKEMKNKK